MEQPSPVYSQRQDVILYTNTGFFLVVFLLVGSLSGAFLVFSVQEVVSHHEL